MDRLKLIFSSFLSLLIINVSAQQQPQLKLNSLDYFEIPGLNVMVFDDIYPEGHQGGVGFIQNGSRVATNGDLRLEPTPGQWDPIPKVGKRTVDSVNQLISVRLTYPDSSKNRQGFNPVYYPDLYFNYTVTVKPEGQSFRILVDLDEPLPEEWVGRVGFNLEFFPGDLFGKAWYMDEQMGTFPRQANGPMLEDPQGEFQIEPMASGRQLVIAPEVPAQRVTITSERDDLSLYDGRGRHNNGWFIVRSLVKAGATQNAVNWLVSPNALPDYHYQPVVQIPQTGFHVAQPKYAVIELDHREQQIENVRLIRIGEDGEEKMVKNVKPDVWGNFLRYKYLKFDFSEIEQEGIYRIRYAGFVTSPFQISRNVYDRHVWQPTLEYFLPVQMCHMRVNDRYKVWHGLCHLDDALMAPVDTNHFDGYKQGPSTLTKYEPYDPVPGLNRGGWHDAGDYDLRVESQGGTVYMLSVSHELFGEDYDQTTVDQENRLVEILRPDGKADILQQIEHGVLTILGGYRNLGRLYRGIICPTIRQYVLLGDASVMTDNRVYDPELGEGEQLGERSGALDDRWVFTEENPRRELGVAADLAAAARALKDYNPELARECGQVAEAIWQSNLAADNKFKLGAAIELLLTTGKEDYNKFLVANVDLIDQQIEQTGWRIGRIMPLIKNRKFQTKVQAAINRLHEKIVAQEKETPYGVPYRPYIWGAGWGIQRFGVEQYFLYKGFPEIFSSDFMLNALSFVLGRHPGNNVSSFASGVGPESLTVAYGVNRDEWSYIPGGVGSGTALIRPDFPELKVWPYFWQQTEYVMGGGATNYMFLVLAARHELNSKLK